VVSVKHICKNKVGRKKRTQDASNNRSLARFFFRSKKYA